MSNQPPPAFGGHPHYAQQWPPPFPPAMSTEVPRAGDYHAPAQMPSLHPSQNMDANMASFYANSHLAGATAHPHPGLFFPPPLPYMNQYSPPQQPIPAYPGMPMQSLGNPPVPIPPGSSIQLPASVDARVVDANRPLNTHHQPHTKFDRIDRNREEGEISEAENGLPAASKMTRGARRTKQKRAQIQDYDLEEGETMSSSSASSSKSGSPYNPSLPVAADPEVVSHAIEMQKRGTTAALSKDTRVVSAEQLRLRAQGALLSLKPHNISYDELVGEGLNPTILKQLYEQVGLKVASQAEKTVSVAANQTALASKPTASVTPGKIDGSRRKSSTAPLAATPSVPSATQPEMGKPMERKEVIARMLAAKAAKSSAVPVKPAPKESQAKSTPHVLAAPGESQSKPNVVAVREKNKAQTELARQRIEELKKQALLKSQQKSQLAQNSQSSQADQSSASAILSSPAAPAVQHPLPVRPPIPQPSEAASIPGLVMTGSKKESGLQAPTDASPAITVDSTPLSRATQRKRPRASDFDEPDAASKRHLGQEKDLAGVSDRLVIEFSDDDESLYGENLDTMDIDSDQGQAQLNAPIATLDTSRPVLQKHSSSTSTPQGPSWQSDNENMRRKDLEIQEMHRRIAELEEKRKAKLAASRTESPRTVEDSVASSSSSSDVQSSQVDVDDFGQSLPSTTKLALDTSKTVADLADRSYLIDSFGKSSVETLATMNLAQLESLRSAICSSDVTDAGLPGLSAAASSSAMDIGQSKEDVLSTLSNTLKDKEQYAELFEELQKLNNKIGGLSLGIMEELRQQAETKQKEDPEYKVSAALQPSSHVTDQLPFQMHASHFQPTMAAPLSTQGHGIDITPNPTHESAQLSSTPHSESMGSAMDESSDVSSPSQGSSSEDEGRETANEQQTLQPLADSTQSQNQDSASISGSSESSEDESSKPLDSDASSSDDESFVPPEHRDPGYPSPEGLSPALDGENVAVGNSVNVDTPSENFHRESSSDSGSDESEAYEPPEPDTASEPKSPYSPPFSPAPHVPVEDEPEKSFASLEDIPADESLTGAPQMAPSEIHPPHQVETHGNNTSAAMPSGSQFTPYISPLRHFKAYRYHPDFTEDVSNGYRSLTYSHDIDAMKYFCPYELAGGVCNDRSCEFQHFRDITLSDDKILIEMGSVREGQTEEEKETYLSGLKEIINEMRRDKVKEFSTVASEIVAYRRRFLQDPSRVLPL